MDVVAFLETMLSDSGSVMERNFLFFSQRKLPDETREHGVGFYGQEYIQPKATCKCYRVQLGVES